MKLLHACLPSSSLRLGAGGKCWGLRGASGTNFFPAAVRIADNVSHVNCISSAAACNLQEAPRTVATVSSQGLLRLGPSKSQGGGDALIFAYPENSSGAMQYQVRVVKIPRMSSLARLFNSEGPPARACQQ